MNSQYYITTTVGLQLQLYFIIIIVCCWSEAAYWLKLFKSMLRAFTNAPEEFESSADGVVYLPEDRQVVEALNYQIQ